MSTCTLRYQPRDDGNGRLRERLIELAGQHRRHGYRMPHSRLRTDGWPINVKRAYRVYREDGLMVRKRRRKKLPVPERQPLVRPIQPNEVWSLDFVFDEPANGRRVKTLTVVDFGQVGGSHLNHIRAPRWPPRMGRPPPRGKPLRASPYAPCRDERLTPLAGTSTECLSQHWFTSLLAATRKSQHHLRCNPLGSRSKCCKTWGAAHLNSTTRSPSRRPTR